MANYLKSDNILDQVIATLEKAGKFSLQTDKSVSTGYNPQLMGFA
jgi:hypothetical protein